MKFLHTADWQIGMRAAQLGDKGERVRTARLESARRVIELARRERVDFILLAGDTFEDNGVERIKVREVAKILGGAGCPVFIIPGNHDLIMPGSVWEDSIWHEWSTIHVLTAQAAIEVPGGTLYPCPVSAKDSRDDPTEWIHALNSGIAIIRLLKTAVDEAKGKVLAGISEPVEKRATTFLERIVGQPFAQIQLGSRMDLTSFRPEGCARTASLAQMSAGEQEQIYFATRLALAEVLSEAEPQVLVLEIRW